MLLLLKVAWLYVEKYTLLTLSKTVITHNSRFKVTHNGHRTWNLVINDVQEKDKGAYMCQINTSPMKYQVGYLDVVGKYGFVFKQSSKLGTIIFTPQCILLLLCIVLYSV